MPTFYVLSGRDIGRTHEAEDGAVLGRAPDCEIPLRERSVSRRHARLEREADGWVLVDLGSSNGILQEGQRVEKLELHDGILFALGDLEMRFRSRVEADDPGAPPAPPPPPEAEPEPAGGGIEVEDPSGGEIEIEGVERLEAPRPASAAPSAGEEARPPAPSAAARERHAAALEKTAARGAFVSSATRPAAGGPDVRDTGRAPLRFSKVAEGRGFLSSDLGQYPPWVRIVAGILALALFVAVFYVAFRSAGFLRDRATGAEFTESPVDE